MRTPVILVSVGLIVGVAACSGSDQESPTDATGQGAGAGTGSGGAGSGAGGAGGAGGGAGGAGGGASCEPFGRFGAPVNTFTLPVPDGATGLNYPDVQASFPEVDWATLDRLYIPAGQYKFMNLGNLPERDAAAPLVITNQGGQVQVGPNDPGGNYIWAVGGGSNWVLTGRYDPESGTGDVAYPGHRCGDYAGSRGHYGFLSDDAFAQGQYLHMGIAVSDATDFELEYLEIFRSGFAGIRLLNKREPGDPERPMANVRVHDNYVHDVDGEGFYFGWTGAPPSNPFPGLKIYNNRIIRAGNEALQIQDLADGTEVHNNVFAFAALHWRDNGLGMYQDNGAQVMTRSGTIVLRENVFLGGAGTLLSFWSQPQAGDADRHVTFEGNYFAATRSLGAYLGGSAAAGSDFHFNGNVFRELDFSYDLLDPAATDPGIVFGVGAGYEAPVVFEGNTWEGSKQLAPGLTGPNGTSGVVTATGNTNGPVTPIVFVATGYPAGASVQRLESWAPKATVAPGSPDIVYQPGDLVMHDAVMYECTTQNSGLTPPDHPEAWEPLPTPIDDFRVEASSPYATVGVN